MQEYQVEVTLTFGVGDAEAVRLAAWEIVADRREIEREGGDVYADRATATTEASLSVLIGRSPELREAMQALAASIKGMTYVGTFASPSSVYPVFGND